MTLAIRWGIDTPERGGFIYFDAITAYSQTYSGSVTKHPIATGASVVDHYIRDNPKFSLSGVITGVDVSTGTFLIKDLDNNKPINTPDRDVSAVSVNSTDDSVLSRLIPASISQFLPDATPSVVMESARVNVIGQVRSALIDLTSGERLNEDTGQFESNVQVVALYEYNGAVISRIINNLVITNVSFREDANTGDALYCDIAFEQVTFAKLKKVTLPPELVAKPVKKAATTKKSIGKCDGTPKATGSADNPDPTTKQESIDSAVNDVDPERAVAAEL